MSYNKKILDHCENPRNVGSFDNSKNDIGCGISGSPSCGDIMKLQIKVNKKNIIKDVCFKTYGCGSAIASSSFITELIKGKSLNEVKKIKNIEIVKKLKLPLLKFHCSVLAEQAIKSAILDLKKKRK